MDLYAADDRWALPGRCKKAKGHVHDDLYQISPDNVRANCCFCKLPFHSTITDRLQERNRFEPPQPEQHRPQQLQPELYLPRPELLCASHLLASVPKPHSGSAIGATRGWFPSVNKNNWGWRSSKPSSGRYLDTVILRISAYACYYSVEGEGDESRYIAQRSDSPFELEVPVPHDMGHRLLHHWLLNEVWLLYRPPLQMVFERSHHFKFVKHLRRVGPNNKIRMTEISGYDTMKISDLFDRNTMPWNKTQSHSTCRVYNAFVAIYRYEDEQVQTPKTMKVQRPRSLLAPGTSPLHRFSANRPPPKTRAGRQNVPPKHTHPHTSNDDGWTPQPRFRVPSDAPSMPEEQAQSTNKKTISYVNLLSDNDEDVPSLEVLGKRLDLKARKREARKLASSSQRAPTPPPHQEDVFAFSSGMASSSLEPISLVDAGDTPASERIWPSVWNDTPPSSQTDEHIIPPPTQMGKTTQGTPYKARQTACSPLKNTIEPSKALIDSASRDAMHTSVAPVDTPPSTPEDAVDPSQALIGTTHHTRKRKASQIAANPTSAGGPPNYIARLHAWDTQSDTSLNRVGDSSQEDWTALSEKPPHASPTPKYNTRLRQRRASPVMGYYKGLANGK